MPEFQAAYEQFNGKDFVVLAVNFGETAATIEAFQSELGLTFPLVMDERGDIQEQFGVFSYPTTYVLNPQGVITQKIVGPMTASQVETLVNAALS
ncbi:MAG: TlpA family protein disulfide reductase [Anaerolineae bacterium]|nr:TlpA family protein disulfide reductase [Anaerolineae bacterium]